MKVLDSKDWAWFLFEHQGSLYLDVNCEMNTVGFSFMIKLNEKEAALFNVSGREYLDELSSGISYSAPASKNTSSIFKGRDVSNEFSKLALDAIKKWRLKK